MPKTTEERIVSVIADLLLVDESEVTPNATLGEDLGADSLDVVELVMDVEEEFDIDITAEDSSTFVTVGDLLKYVTGAVKA